MTSRTRRAVLTTLTSVGLAGCTTFDDSESSSEDELPDQCPTSRDLDVPWPRDIYTGSVRGFVTGYEDVGEFVTAYEEAYLVEKHQSEYDSVNFSVQLDQNPDKVADGFHVTVTFDGSATTERYLLLETFEVDSDGIPKEANGADIDESVIPDNIEYIPIDEVEDQNLHKVLKSAADSGYGESSTSHTDQYAQLIEAHSPNTSLNDGYPPGVYFDVNGTPVLLLTYEQGGDSAVFEQSTPVQYYVTEYVIRRTTYENELPQDGTLVECRLPE